MNEEETPDLPPDEEEDEKEDSGEEGQSFAELFEAYSEERDSDLRVGDKVRAEVISIGQDTVFLDIGDKIDGVAEKQELLDESGRLPFNVGDVIELYVVARDEAEIRLSRAVSGVGGENMLQEAHDNRIPVEGKVTGPCKGGVNVEIFKRRAFCPISQLDLNFVEDPAVHVGQTYEFLITRLEGGGKNIVVSRRKLLAEAQAKAQKAFFETLAVDSVLDGRVTRIAPFGAFVELAPGVEGMVHVSELSWSRVGAPQDVVAEGDPVRVKVLAVEDGAKAGQKKISLSMKQIGGDPWETELQRFAAGQRVLGTVTRCAPFGAFVEIAPGIEGMVHISELSFTRRVTRPEEVVQPGEVVSVLIREIDAAKRRISLSLREAQGDPWLEVTEKFAVGQTVAGTVEKRERFGIFVNLAPGVTGLLPKSKIAQASDPAAFERLRPGDPVAVSVAEIDVHGRRITLASGDAAEADDWRSYGKQQAAGGLGSLGEQLQRAMSKRKDK